MSRLTHAVYGHIPAGLVEVDPASVQCSPQVPGAAALAELAPQSCTGFVMHAPASTLERRHAMALALRALAPGAPLTVLAANDKGGTRLGDELEAFGCAIEAASKRHHRIISTTRLAAPHGLEEAIAAGDPRLIPELGLWSQPGLFNWDRVDPGSQLLLDHLPPLKGRGADLGCGTGVLARAVIANNPGVHMTLIDIDQRALSVARMNVSGEGVSTLWADVRTAKTLPAGLDFVVTNPPFHDAGAEDRALGAMFIQRACAMLRPGGALWLTANRHLPYEAVLEPLFETVDQVAQAIGFKIYAAKRGSVSAVATRSRPPAAKARR